MQEIKGSQESKGGFRYFPIKFIFVMIHLIALSIFILGIGGLYTIPSSRSGSYWLSPEIYEESEEFVAQFESDTKTIFDYIFLEKIFQTTGVFDETKSLFTIQKDNQISEEYTISDVLKKAADYGYYFDTNFVVKVTDGAENFPYGIKQDIEREYQVIWRAYDYTSGITHEGTSSMTLKELILESMKYLGRYYAAHRLLEEGQSNIKYRLAYGKNIYTNDESFVYDTLKDYGKYVTVKSGDPIVETNFSQVPENFKYLSDFTANYLDENYQVMLAIDTNYPKQDHYAEGKAVYIHNREQYYRGLFLSLLGLGMMVLSLGILSVLSGVPYQGAKERVVYSVDKMGIEVNIFLTFVTMLFLGFLSERIGYNILRIILPMESHRVFEFMLDSVLQYLCVLVLFFSILRTVKAGEFSKNSVLVHIKNEYGVYANRETFVKGLARNFLLFCIVNIAMTTLIAYFILGFSSWEKRLLAFCLGLILIAFNIITYQKLYTDNWQREKIAELVKRMSNGDTSSDLNTLDFIGKEAEIVKNLNHLNQGLKKAIADQVKSERMKADLITNVSHDIKTPLTSIINYVDLMKREEPKDPIIMKYLEILDKKSQHLKNLTEDLVEASKASSGNLSLEITDIDFVDMIKQTNGEFEEKYETRDLIIISNLPKEHLFIRADGRRLWRVLENIYNNAYKYAAPSSRVYVEIQKTNDMAVFTIKNISEKSLNISPDELTERFVRGDVSRTTEGSGLGLSIARSMTELQKGNFEIKIDGDLFKVILSFPLASQKVT